MGKFFFWLLKLFGWKIDDRAPIGVNKAVCSDGTTYFQLGFHHWKNCICAL